MVIRVSPWIARNPRFEEWEKRVHPDDVGQATVAVRAHLAGKSALYDVEFRFKRKTDEWMWIRARGRIVARGESGEPLRMVGTHTDITERKLAEDERLSLERQVQYSQKLESLGVLARWHRP